MLRLKLNHVSKRGHWAFDKIRQALLIPKLNAYGLSEDACNLITNYMRNRKYRVKIMGTCCEWVTIDHGVHYIDVIMTTIASQITSLTVVYSTVYPDADQRKHQSSASLAFVRGIHRDRWIPRTKGQLRGKCLHLMTSSCLQASVVGLLLFNFSSMIYCV